MFDIINKIENERLYMNSQQMPPMPPAVEPPKFRLAITDEIDFKFNEKEHIENFIEYIIGTYSQHYAQDKIQAYEFIADCDHGPGFSVGNIIKYAKRLNKKEGESDIKDIHKIIHYAILYLYAKKLKEDKQ